MAKNLKIKNNYLGSLYYKNARAAMIVFDLTNKKTLQNAKTWIDELNENASLDILIALIGNKADMESERQMTYEVRKSL